MTEKRKKSNGKISSEFAARLHRLSPHEKVRAIVLISAKKQSQFSSKRQSLVERQVAIDTLQKSVEGALTDMTNILSKYDGKLLSKKPDNLGSIPIEVTAAGVKALATSKWVKAIIEDQKIHPVL